MCAAWASERASERLRPARASHGGCACDCGRRCSPATSDWRRGTLGDALPLDEVVADVDATASSSADCEPLRLALAGEPLADELSRVFSFVIAENDLSSGDAGASLLDIFFCFFF